MNWIQTFISLAVAVLALLSARRTRRTVAMGVSAGIEAERAEAQRVERLRLEEFVRTSAAATSAARDAEARLVYLLDQAHAEQLAFEQVHPVHYDVPSRRRAVQARLERALHQAGQPQHPQARARVRQLVQPKRGA